MCDISTIVVENHKIVQLAKFAHKFNLETLYLWMTTMMPPLNPTLEIIFCWNLWHKS